MKRRTFLRKVLAVLGASSGGAATVRLSGATFGNLSVRNYELASATFAYQSSMWAKALSTMLASNGYKVVNAKSTELASVLERIMTRVDPQVSERRHYGIVRAKGGF